MLCIDLSSNNSAPDFNALKARGVEGVWIKVSEGVGYPASNDAWDVTSAVWAASARKAGLRVGKYHFARPNDGHSAAEQADWFVKHAGKVQRRDLRPVLDYEDPAAKGGDEAWIHEFNRIAGDALGVGLLFYSNPNVIDHIKLTKPVGYGLWLADYTGVAPAAPHPWKKYVAWQYTDSGMVGTYGKVDMSHTYGNAVLAHPIIGLV